MNVQNIVLGMLVVQPNYGYELKKTYDILFGSDKPILSGQIYSTLSRLLRDKKIRDIKDDESSGGPERLKYEITEKGFEHFQNWLLSPEDPSPNLKANLYIKTVLALINKENAYEYLDKQKQAHIAKMRELTQKRRGSDIGTRLLIDYAIHHIEADIKWIDSTTLKLESLKEDICQKM